MPPVMPMKVLEVGLSDCVIKPMPRIFERFARLARPKTLSRPLPRSKTAFKAASAISLSGTCTASSFIVREMLGIRDFQSTMSQVRPYWLPFHWRRPSPKPGRVGSCITVFGAGSAFTHVTAYMLAESPMRPSTPKASAASLPPPLLRLLPGGANQFPGGFNSRCGPPPFTAHPVTRLTRT